MKGSLDSIPNEILAIIEPQLHLRDVASLVLSCQSLHAALTPLLYRRVSGHVEITLWAAARGEVGILEKMLHAGADLDMKSSWEATTCSFQRNPDLYHSITFDALQYKPSARFSLQHTLHRRSRLFDIGGWDHEYREVVRECRPKTLTALTLAAKMGHEQAIDFLLLHDASIEQRCRQICYCECVCSGTPRLEMDLDPDPYSHCKYEYEWAPLHLAIHHSHLGVAKKLMAEGALFEGCRSEHPILSTTNALDVASAAGDTAMFAAVFDHFASSINQWHKRDALDVAYIHRSMNIFHVLLDHGVEIDDPATHSYGTTILMEACASENFTDAFWKGTLLLLAPFPRTRIDQSGIARLLHLGADASKTTEMKMTPLNCLCGGLDRMMRAWCRGLYEDELLELEDNLSDLRATMGLLLRNGADPNSCPNTSLLGHRLVAGFPLVTAAKWCQIDMITLLLDYDADIDACDQHSHSPLWAASFTRMHAQDMVATMTLLIERGASVHTVDESNGRTILDKITQQHGKGRADFTALVSMVLDRGFTPESGVHRDTWIEGFFCCDQLECCKLLSEHGAPDPGSQDLMRMLQYAIEHNSPEAMAYVLAFKGMERLPISKSHLEDALCNHADQVAHLLLKHSAPWTHVSREEWTKLLLACDSMSHDVRVHTLLLERGADPNTMLQAGFTPLQRAVFWGNLPFVQALLENGADPDLTGTDCFSPMENAHQLSEFHILKLLLERSEVKGKVRKGWKNKIYNGLAMLKRARGLSTDAS